MMLKFNEYTMQMQLDMDLTVWMQWPSPVDTKVKERIEDNVWQNWRNPPVTDTNAGTWLTEWGAVIRI